MTSSYSILWHRMGTPTYDQDSGTLFPSGTALEFDRAYRAWRPERTAATHAVSV